jgi:hypothetical protein
MERQHVLELIGNAVEKSRLVSAAMAARVVRLTGDPTGQGVEIQPAACLM